MLLKLKCALGIVSFIGKSQFVIKSMLLKRYIAIYISVWDNFRWKGAEAFSPNRFPLLAWKKKEKKMEMSGSTRMLH